MDFKEITIYTTTLGIDHVAQVLENCKVEGYVLEDSADFEAFLEGTEIYWDYVDEDLVAEKKRQETCLKIYLPDDTQGEKQYQALLASLGALKTSDCDKQYGRLETEIAITRQEDWEWGWKQYFKPFPVGETFLIKPSWETVEDAGARRVLEIDPASSFGTGTHDTTQLCIGALERHLKTGDAVLDMGTGSGILSIVAAMLGGQVQTIVDIDENCIKTAHENAAKNGMVLGKGICGDVLKSPTLTEDMEKAYDVILANIVADIIIGMTGLFWDKLKARGTLICSGILNERAEEVEKALRAGGFSVLERNESKGWIAFVAKKD